MTLSKDIYNQSNNLQTSPSKKLHVPNFILLQPRSFANECWSIANNSGWAYVKRIRNELTPDFTFCKRIKHQVLQYDMENICTLSTEIKISSQINNANTKYFSSGPVTDNLRASFTVICSEGLFLNQISQPYFLFIYSLQIWKYINHRSQNADGVSVSL